MIELRSHQKQAVERARDKKNLAIFHEAGTGKTATLIHILREDYNAHKRVRKTLIFAPLSVCAQWKVEFEKFSKIPEERILILTGSGTKRSQALREKNFKHGIVVTNYEGLQIQLFYDELLKWAPEIVVLDESHRVKDAASKRAKLLYPLTHSADRRFLLTGTPILNSLMDIFGQYKALDPSIFGPGFWSFRSRYFFNRNAHKRFSFPEWLPHPFALKEIGAKISETSVQAKLSDCLDLPELIQIPVQVPLGIRQGKAFKEMKKDFLTEIGGKVVTAEFAMTKALRLLQVTAGYLRPDDETEPVWFDEVPRLRVLSDLLESIGDHKVIIWTTFQPTYKKIGDLVETQGKKYAFLTGEQSTRQKEESLAQFNCGDTQVLISNPAAGGVGLNLQVARYAIFFNRGYSLEHWLQSQARNYRSGSERHPSIVHYILTSPGTLDPVIDAALDGKQNVAEAVLSWANNSLDPLMGVE